MKASGIFLFAQALELCKQKLLQTQSFMIEKVNLYICGFFFYRFKKAFEFQSQHYSQELIMRSSSWHLGTSLNLPLSSEKVGNYSLRFTWNQKSGSNSVQRKRIFHRLSCFLSHLTS